MIVTVKNEVNRARGQAARSPEQGLAGAPPGSTRDKTKIDFFKPEIWAIYQHASIRFAFRRAFHGDGSPVRFFISTTEQGVTRAFRCTRAAQDSLRLKHRSWAHTDPFRLQGKPTLLLIIYLSSLVSTFPKLYQAKINNSTTVQQQQHTQYHHTYYLFIYF